MSSNQKTARLAGAFYLSFILALVVSGVVRSKLVVFGDPVATANNIAASVWLFRLDIVMDLLSAVFFLLAAWALYVLLNPVDKGLSLLFLALLSAGVAVQVTSLLGQVAAMLLLSGADYLRAFAADQLRALAMLSLDLHRSGFMLAQIFFGTWLFPLGILVLRSGFLPRILGILLIVDGFGVLMWFCQFFLFPGYEAFVVPGLAASFLAEVSLASWLLVKGVKS